MATISSLVDRVRMELGDIGKSFVQQFVADGTTNRFRLHYAPLDGTTVQVILNSTDISAGSSVEEQSGVLVTDIVPIDGDEITVSGNYYRYFTGQELVNIVESALAMHSNAKNDQLGRKVLPETLPFVEEYPVVIYAVSLALHTLATDASFDIDIIAPDGVNIPRAERYRQLMEQVQVRENQYRDLCAHLGIGMYKMETFTFRRQSKTTGRYVPVYKPQEVDDKSYPQRVRDVKPTYGDKPYTWPTESAELTAYQKRAFSTSITLDGDYTGIALSARLLNQRNGILATQEFAIIRVDNTDTNDLPVSTTLTISLTADQTMRVARRTYWSISQVVSENESIEIKGGNFFTTPASEVIL